MDGTLYDGITAHPHRVQVVVEPNGLLLTQDNGWTDRVGAASLKRMHDSGAVRLARTDLAGWRLLLTADSAGEIEPLLGREDRYGRWIDRVGLVPALLIGGALTVAVLGFGHVAPHWLAPHVPLSWERNVGGAIVGDFGSMRCRNADGQRALEALVERVAPGSTTGPDAIKVAALNEPIFNAAALPGGYIIVFKPAITDTDAEALAGILAHEVAHVRRRHVTEALLRELGIGAIVRLFAGNLGANAEQLVSLSFTRDNEAQADADAIVALKRAGISPMPTAALFQRLSKEQEQDLSSSAQFLQSHPLSRGRAERFAASFDRNAHYTPALSRDQADALFNVCWHRPPARSSDVKGT